MKNISSFFRNVTIHTSINLVAGILVTLSIPVTLFLVSHNQDIRQRAYSTPGGGYKEGAECTKQNDCLALDGSLQIGTNGKSISCQWGYSGTTGHYCCPAGTQYCASAQKCTIPSGCSPTSPTATPSKTPTPTSSSGGGGGTNPTAIPTQPPVGGVVPTGVGGTNPTAVPNPGNGNGFNISGNVYIDIDENGRLTGPDVILDNQKVKLSSGQETTTNANGRYEFNEVASGSNKITLVFDKQGNTANFEKTVGIYSNIVFDFALRISFQVK